MPSEMNEGVCAFNSCSRFRSSVPQVRRAAQCSQSGLWILRKDSRRQIRGLKFTSLTRLSWTNGLRKNALFLQPCLCSSAKSNFFHVSNEIFPDLRRVNTSFAGPCSFCKPFTNPLRFANELRGLTAIVQTCACVAMLSASGGKVWATREHF
jgi:hypothetical protein